MTKSSRESNDPMIEYVRVQSTLPYPIGLVWAVIESFGALKAWMKSIESCSLEGTGIGAVRAVTIAGQVTRERLEDVQPASYRVSYSLLQPHSLPATEVRGTIQLNALGPAETHILWWSEASNIRGPAADLSAFVERFYLESIEGLKGLLDRGAS